MENIEKYEYKLVYELRNQLLGKLDGDKIGAFIYEICYLRYLSLRTFKQIAQIKDISLEEFIIEYNKCLDNIVHEDVLILSDESNISDFDYIQMMACAREVLNDIESFKYSLKDITKIIHILCSYNNIVIKNVMLLDLFDRSRFIFQTPDSICKIINSVLDINKNDSVLDICSSYGNYLVSVSSCCEYKLLSGIEINNILSLISRLRLLILTGTCDILTDDLFNKRITKKYDKVLCNFPWGYRIEKHQLDYLNENTKDLKFNWDKITSSSVDWLFINILLSSIKDNGKGATIIPSGILFKKPDEIYRKDLIDNGCIEAIIKIPVLTGFTSIDQYLVVFSNNNTKVKFVDISSQINKRNNNLMPNMSSIFEILDSDDSDFVTYVDNNKLAENNYLLKVENYVGKKEVKYYNPHVLSEYVEDVFRGYQMTSKEQSELESENGEYEILTISDIENGIISDNLKRIEASENKYDRYLLKENDLIISSKGTRIKIAVAENIQDRKIIANGNLIVLRIRVDELNPHYLEAYLNSADGQIILNQIQTGSVIISINPSNLVDIKISMLSMKDQEEIGNKYKAQKKLIELTKDRLLELEKQKENFFENFVKENLIKE